MVEAVAASIAATPMGAASTGEDSTNEVKKGFGVSGLVDGYGYGNDNGSADWYGISSGHDGCPLFRQRVMTRDGWRVRMVPIC